MDTPSEGSVVLDGVDISRENAASLTRIRRDKIGLIFQQFHLISYLTAVENVMLAQYYHSMPDEEEAMEALAKVGLAERARHVIIKKLSRNPPINPSQIFLGPRTGRDRLRRSARQV